MDRIVSQKPLSSARAGQPAMAATDVAAAASATKGHAGVGLPDVVMMLAAFDEATGTTAGKFQLDHNDNRTVTQPNSAAARCGASKVNGVVAGAESSGSQGSKPSASMRPSCGFVSTASRVFQLRTGGA